MSNKQYLKLTAIVICTIVLRQSLPAQASDRAELVIKMDPYVISAQRELPQPESWRYVAVPSMEVTVGSRTVLAPGYEVLSNLTLKQTQVFVQELQLRQFAGALIWPNILRALPRQPLVVILDRDKQAGLGAETLAPLTWQGDPIVQSTEQTSGSDSLWLHESQQTLSPDPILNSGLFDDSTVTSNPLGLPVPVNLGQRSDANSSGQDVFADGRELRPLAAGYTVVRARNGMVVAQIGAGSPLAGDIVAKPTEELLAADLARRSAEFALSSFSQRPPSWAISGFGWLIGSTRVTATRIVFADTFGMMRQRYKVPSLKALFAKKDRLSSDDDLLAAAFVHYCLYGTLSTNAEKLIEFLRQPCPPEKQADRFVQVFGISIEKMEKQLASYAQDFAAYRSYEIKGNFPPMPVFTVREATQSEVGRIKAAAFIAQNKSDLALSVLRISYWRGEREPEMLALLASFEGKYGSIQRAEKITSALLGLPQPPARAYLSEAQLLFQGFCANKKPGEKLAVNETSEILRPLGRALGGGMESEDVYTFLAEVVSRSGGRPHESIVNMLDRAAKKWPANDKIARVIEPLKNQPER